MKPHATNLNDAFNAAHQEYIARTKGLPVPGLIFVPTAQEIAQRCKRTKRDQLHWSLMSAIHCHSALKSKVPLKDFAISTALREMDIATMGPKAKKPAKPAKNTKARAGRAAKAPSTKRASMVR